MGSFLPWYKNSDISICIYSKVYDIPRGRQTDMTFCTPVWGSVSFNPINSMVQSVIWVVMAQVLQCHAKGHSPVIALLQILAVSLGNFPRYYCHWWHHICTTFIDIHTSITTLYKMSAQSSASVLHIMLDELWPSISLLHLLLCSFALPPVGPPTPYTTGKCTWQCVILYGKDVCIVGKLAFNNGWAYH